MACFVPGRIQKALERHADEVQTVSCRCRFHGTCTFRLTRNPRAPKSKDLKRSKPISLPVR